jgi:hypothetical protein
MLNKLKGKGIKRKLKLLINLTTSAPARYLKAAMYKRNSKKLKFLEQKYFEFTAATAGKKTISEFLKDENIPFDSGKFCVTISDQNSINKFSEYIFNFYQTHCENDFCLKIYLSQHFVDDTNAYYVFDNGKNDNGIEKSVRQLSIRSHGTIKDTISVSNILSLNKITPRVYDAFILKWGDKKYIVQVVESFPVVSLPDKIGDKLITNLKDSLKKEEIKIVGPSDPWSNKDFTPPLYGNNIGTRDSEVRYVDIQKFIFKNRIDNIKKLVPEIRTKTHFGDEHKSVGGRYNYQSIPFLGEWGKRRIELRMQQMLDAYQKFGFDIDKKTILDVGCNMAGFASQYLSKGAKWYIGLDKKELVDIARKFLYYLNFSRFDLFGMDLNNDNPLGKLERFGRIDLILFLSMQKHIGIPQWLNELDYSFMFYEGHQNEAYLKHEELLKKHLTIKEIHYVGESNDGETKRPLFLCMK